MSRPTLAAALIVKNEAHHIEDCLNSLQTVVDEIIVLDGGSEDKTVELAQKYTTNIYVHTDWQGYGKQRQQAQKYVKSDWIFWIDADERMTPTLAQEVKKVIQYAHAQCVFSVPRLSWVFGHCIRYCGWYPDRVIRLHPKNLTHYNNALVHEKLILNQSITVQPLTADLLHFTYRNMEHYLTKSATYAHMWATQRYQQSKKTTLCSAIGHGVGCFMRMFIFKRGFLDGQFGFLLSLLSAHSTFAKYAALWVMTKSPMPKAQAVVKQVTDQ